MAVVTQCYRLINGGDYESKASSIHIYVGTVVRDTSALQPGSREGGMSFEALLDRLDGLKETGPGKYLSRCPSHDDRSPSLAIKDGDDGRILLHCFAGCETENVLSAIGLTFADVMPERIGQEHAYKPVRNRISAKDALSTLYHESLVVAIIGADFLEHKEY